MAERAQWRRDVYSWKGSWSDVPSPHALSYYTDNPFLRDEVNDLCVVCTPAGKAESPKKYAVRTEVKPVGVLAGFRVFDVLYYLGERGQGAPAAPKWKSILVEVGPDSLQEIFHLQASRVPVSLKPSSIVQSGGERVLVSMDRDGGNGGGCWEGYWWFDRDGPHRLDFSGLEAAIKNQLPEGVIAQVSCANLNLGEQIVRSWVRKIQPECRTCDVIGEVTARYRLNGASVVPIEVKFRLTEPRLEQNLSVGKSAGDALRADRSSNRHPQARYLKSILYHEARLRPALRAWLTDRENGDAARYLLALIGEPEDLRLALSIAPPLTEDNDNRWASSVACALMEPNTQNEWAFLRRAALNEYSDRWVDAGAIQSLKLIASPRSRQILEEVRERNPARAKLVKRAIQYIDSNPEPLVDDDLERLARRAAQAVAFGRIDYVDLPFYNRSGDKALVEFAFIAGVDRLIYVATFHRVGGVWRFRGARETLQQMMPPIGVIIPHRHLVFLPEPPELPSLPSPPVVMPDFGHE